jgi:hypothetical protein
MPALLVCMRCVVEKSMMVHDRLRPQGIFMAGHFEQISVPLPPELRAFVVREAQREDRSQASVIRRLVAEAARAAQAGERPREAA